MRASLNIESEAGVAVLADPQHVPSHEVIIDADRKRLRRLAEEGKIFFLDAEDPNHFRIDLYIDEEPDLPQHRYQRVGGSFLLLLPSGRLVVTGDHHFDAEPGAYSVTVFEHAVVEPGAIEQEREAVLTSEQWRYRRRIERAAAPGCLLVV